MLVPHTVHKVKGITFDSAVVCLGKTFAAGQAHVALSLVKSLSGLFFQDFEKVVVQIILERAIKSMPMFLFENIARNLSAHTFSVFLINV